MKFQKYIDEKILNASRELKEIGVQGVMHVVSGIRKVWDFIDKHRRLGDSGIMIFKIWRKTISNFRVLCPDTIQSQMRVEKYF